MIIFIILLLITFYSILYYTQNFYTRYLFLDKHGVLVQIGIVAEPHQVKKE